MKKRFLKMMLPLLLAISSGGGFLSYGYSVVVSLVAATTVGVASLAVSRKPYYWGHGHDGSVTAIIKTDEGTWFGDHSKKQYRGPY